MATILISPFCDEAPFGARSNQTLQPWPEELSSIYTTHHGHVLRVCRRFFRHREDAEDAAAEVFLKLHRVLDKKDPTSPFRPWLSRVAGRHCIDKLRHNKHEASWCVAGMDGLEVPDDLMVSPLSRVLSKEKQLQVRKQLNRLPDHYKVPLVLRYYKRMSYSEIARALNSRLPAVRMIIFRAKNELRRNLRLLRTQQVVTGLH